MSENIVRFSAGTFMVLGSVASGAALLAAALWLFRRVLVRTIAERVAVEFANRIVPTLVNAVHARDKTTKDKVVIEEEADPDPKDFPCAACQNMTAKVVNAVMTTDETHFEVLCTRCGAKAVLDEHGEPIH